MSDRRLTFDRLATTEDTGDPVVRAAFPKAGSFMDVILNMEERRIHVWLVNSNVRGDMQKMLDEVVEQTGITTVWFLTPLDELHAEAQATLLDRLHEFEEEEHEYVDPTTDETEYQTVYVGEWDPEYDG